MAATIQIEHIISILAFITTWVIFVLTWRRQLKNERNKQEKKFALKENVKEKFDNMEKRVSNVEEIVERNRRENLSAHKDLKNEVTKHFDDRFEDFKDYMTNLVNNLKAS